MKKYFSRIIFIWFLTSPCFLINSQSLDVLLKISQEDKVSFNYSYEEFNQFAYLDSSIILESFSGLQNLLIDSIRYVNSDTSKYYLTLEKIGIKVKRTFFDTISVENINSRSKEIIYEIENNVSTGGENQIFGWVFPDTLLKSIVDTFDVIPMYPYSKLFRFYYPGNDDSLYFQNDTLFIHYRPHVVNYFDSYFSMDYHITINQGLIYYSKLYSYFGEGIIETYKFTETTMVDNFTTDVPNKFYLSQNYPNPFNPTTKINWYSPVSGWHTLKVYDMLGNEVATLVNEEQTAGSYEVEFNARRLASGLYIYTLNAGHYISSKKMILLK